MSRTAAAVFLVFAVLSAGSGGPGYAGSDEPGPAVPGTPARTSQLAAGSREPAQPPRWLERLTSYMEAVREHKPGMLDMPARLTGFLGENDLYEVRNDYFALVAIAKRELGRSAKPPPIVYKDSVMPTADVIRLIGLTEQEASAANANRVLLRAAILHADVAMLVVPLLPGWTGCAPRGSMLVQDGNRVGSGCICIHWAHARLLLDAVRPDPARDEAVRLWYVATITFLLETGDYASADPQLARAGLLFPSDPEILFEHGLYHEGFASPFIQAAALEAGADPRAGKSHIEEAEDLYRQAVKENPDFVEARVHYGYVLGLVGRHKDAAEQLRLAAAAARGPQLRYYAELFLGQAEERLRNHAAARDHYAQASALFAGAQSPLLALALLARQQGDRAGAQEAMRQVMALSPGRSVEADPWWSYRRWQNQNFESRFAELQVLLARSDDLAYTGGGRR